MSLPAIGEDVDTAYEYTAITEHGTIRIMRLEPSLDIEAELRVRLIHERLNDYEEGIAGHYTALSYVWGDATDIRTVVVDGKRLSITASLHCASYLSLFFSFPMLIIDLLRWLSEDSFPSLGNVRSSER
ncbi:hypothetical protein ONS95_000044 [Cadophora gregata]|uniref:uncharacterized protein n=1 Tax=Cadophora gregata TaxID=51156 RepID=UPI0026DCC84A|nr:uncharacterized protein ONS95_000044 [Cadophora gregata]KAK0115689.1 hypothetical protein ONS96_014134 [Cadophora gregata f. sp. sojae]KAK0128059.1 hypothetical protein ONS95_000044 [Cadophora gregata]